MNKKTLPLLTGLLLLAAAPALQAQIQTVESNVTLSFKIYDESDGPDTVSGAFSLRQYQTFSLKNADFISNLGSLLDKGFSPKARIIRRITFSEGTQTGPVKYFIRDPEITPDTDISAYWVTNRPGDNEAEKRRLKADVLTGTRNVTETYEVDLTMGENYMEIEGLKKSAFRYILSDESLVELETSTLKASGEAALVKAIKDTQMDLAGVLVGSMKISGSKVVPTPDP